MLTFDDLVRTGEDDIARGEFCEAAVNQFFATREYRDAQIGYAYYSKHNVTIEQYQKMIRTITGRLVPDYWSSNYKLKTLFFRRLVTQQVQYVLGNGLTLENPKDKKKLGKGFDYKLQSIARKAMYGGVAFGFWNYDHLEVFSYADSPSQPGFCPLKSEQDASVRAGIRFWFKQVGTDTVARYTLYEEDGYTEYKRTGSEEVEVLQAKRGYKIKETSIADGTIVDICEENYSRLPIVPMYANEEHESELVGMREDIDCYDLIKSGMANVIDDSSEIFWLIQNSGGMDNVDLAELLQRIRNTRSAVVDSDGGGSITPQTINVPTDARQAMLEILRRDIYEDFQSIDIKTLSAAQKTTQEIQAAYQAMDNKCAEFEYNVLEFVQGILDIAGIDDNPSFVWNKIVNQKEQTEMILSAANYLTDEMVIKKLPFLTPEEAEEVISQRYADQQNQFSSAELLEEENEEDPEEDGEEAEEEQEA